jgi:magnesium transporter
MLSVYVPRDTSLERIAVEAGEAPPARAVWIDLLTPSVQEDKLIE